MKKPPLHQRNGLQKQGKKYTKRGLEWRAYGTLSVHGYKWLINCQVKKEDSASNILEEYAKLIVN